MTGYDRYGRHAYRTPPSDVDVRRALAVALLNAQATLRDTAHWVSEGTVTDAHWINLERTLEGALALVQEQIPDRQDWAASGSTETAGSKPAATMEGWPS